MFHSAETASDNKSWIIVFLAILGLASFLRLFNLGIPSIGEDEAYHAVTALAWAKDGAPIPPSGIPYTRGLPLIFLEMLSLRFVPLSFETALRLPVAVLGILNTYLFFQIGKRYGHRNVGLLVACAFAVSPWSQYFGTHLRMYELLLTCALITILAFDKTIQNTKVSSALVLLACLCLGIASHALGILLLILPLAGLIVYHNRIRQIAVLAGTCIVAIAFSFLYPALKRWLWPPPDSVGSAASGGKGMVELSSDALVFAIDHAAWLWAVAVVVMLWFVVKEIRSERVFSLSETPIWSAFLVIFGMLGVPIVSAFLFAGFFAVSGLSEKNSVDIMSARRRLFMMLVGLAVSWITILTYASVVAGEPLIQSLVHNVKALLRFPDLYYAVFQPLILETQVSLLFGAGVIIAATFMLRGLLHKPLMRNNGSFASRILFILGAVFIIAGFKAYYRDDRYLYFVLAPALLCFAEVSFYYYSHLRSKLFRYSIVALVGIFLVFQFQISLSNLPYAQDGAENATKRQEYVATYTRASINYRALGETINTGMDPGDILLADSAHQLQTYVPVVQGHLSPPIREYEHGSFHYFTGSRLFRQPIELFRYLSELEVQEASNVWVVLTGYPSIWSEILPSPLQGFEYSRDGNVRIYRVPAVDLLRIVEESSDSFEKNVGNT